MSNRCSRSRQLLVSCCSSANSSRYHGSSVYASTLIPSRQRGTENTLAVGKKSAVESAAPVGPSPWTACEGSLASTRLRQRFSSDQVRLWL